MKLPRDISGRDLIRALECLGYRVTRQAGSHVRLTTDQLGEHHVTIPDHRALRLGTLSGIMKDVADHFGLTREEIADRVFGK